MKYLINDDTYLYDDYPCTKKQFIRDNKDDGYKWYVNGNKHAHKRINGKEYMVLYVEKPYGTMYAKRMIWDDYKEDAFGNCDGRFNIDYVELITEVENLEEI